MGTVGGSNLRSKPDSYAGTQCTGGTPPEKTKCSPSYKIPVAHVSVTSQNCSPQIWRGSGCSPTLVKGSANANRGCAVCNTGFPGAYYRRGRARQRRTAALSKDIGKAFRHPFIPSPHVDRVPPLRQRPTTLRPHENVSSAIDRHTPLVLFGFGGRSTTRNPRAVSSMGKQRLRRRPEERLGH